jgi:hypothetical protein
MSNRTKPRLKDRLKTNRRAERRVTIYTRGDLYAELEDLDTQLVQAEARPSDRLNAGADKRRLSEQIEKLRAEMAESEIVFRLRALPPGSWNRMVLEHPPRSGNKADEKADVNLDEFNLALVRASIVDPDIDDEDWAALLDPENGIADPQFDDLVQAAWALNKVSVSVPFSRAASRTLQPSDPG